MLLLNLLSIRDTRITKRFNNSPEIMTRKDQRQNSFLIGYRVYAIKYFINYQTADKSQQGDTKAKLRLKEVNRTYIDVSPLLVYAHSIWSKHDRSCCWRLGPVQRELSSPEGKNPFSDPGVRECVNGFSTRHTLSMFSCSTGVWMWMCDVKIG